MSPQIWLALLHPNILREISQVPAVECLLIDMHFLEFLGANVFDDRPFIVMPYLKNGNARDYVNDHPDCNRTLIVRHSRSHGTQVTNLG
jgi:hypothetical protein